MPKISWNIFKVKFDGREQEIFEFLSYILFLREFNQPAGIERYKNQTGIETEPIQINGEQIGFQAKFYDTKISDNKNDIKDSIRKAKGKNPDLKKVYFYLNQEFSESSDTDKKKPKYQTEIEKFAKSQSLEIVWRVPSHFEAQIYDSKNKDLERDFFTLSAEAQFDEEAFEDYLRAVKDFSSRTPYLTLNSMLSGSEITLDDVYIPLPLQVLGGDAGKSNVEPENESDSTIPVSEESDTPNVDEKSKQEDVVATKIVASFAEVIKALKERKNKEHILIQGIAGAGKSTILHRIAKDAWSNPAQLGLDKPHLPLIIRLRTLAGVKEAPLEEKLSRSVLLGGDIRTLKKLPDNFFSQWSRQKGTPWLIMLDGLDEVAAAERVSVLEWIKDFINEVKDIPHLIVLTSRPFSEQRFQDLGKTFLVGNLLTFDRDQQKEFAARWFPNQAEDFLAKVARFSRKSIFREKMEMTPLLLTIAAVVYERTGDLPETGRNELYKSFIDILFDEAENRGLKDELGDKLFSVAQSALERLALEMTDNPEKNNYAELSRICSAFVQETLNYHPIHAKSEGEKLCEVLTRRSGILHNEGGVCLWIHATMREYLAARALNDQIEYAGYDFQTALGERILDAKNYEMLMAFSRNFSRRRDLIKWMCEWTRQRHSANAANLAYDIWEESEQSIQLALREDIILALGSSFGDRHIGLSLRDAIKRTLVQMGEPAVQPLLDLLAEYNNLQSSLVAELPNPDERPERGSEAEEKLDVVYRIRTEIIKILGGIGDERAIEPLIDLLPHKKQSGRNHYYISDITQKALSCIGHPVLAPLLAKIREETIPVEWRCDYLRCLIVIGIRTEEVSGTLGEVLREGLNGNEKLLADAIFAANSLRDEKQTEFVKSALKANNLDIIGRAADYFSIMPDKSAIALLEKAFKKCCANTEAKNYDIRHAVERLVNAIFANGGEKSKNSVLEFLKENLRREGILSPHESVNLLSGSKLKIVPLIYVQELARQLKLPEPGLVVDSLLGAIAQMWRPEQLDVLGNAAASELSQIQNEEENFIAKLISLVNKTPPKDDSQSYPLSERINKDEIVRTLANCRVPNFGLQVGRLFSNPSFYHSLEIHRILWVAGDAGAESFLLDKLQELAKWRKPEQESSADKYYVIRALATCSTEKGAETVISFIRENPNLSIYLPDEVLRPMLRRKVIDTDLICHMAVDRAGTHEFARTFCLETLGEINVPEFTDVFLDALKNESDKSEYYGDPRSSAAHILGWVKDERRKEVIKELENTLIRTNNASIASWGGRALVRLKSKGSRKLLEKTIVRFGGGEKMSDLLRAVAHFRAESTFELLPGVQDDERLYPRTDRNIIEAFGKYYATKEKAREVVRTRFETAYRGYDSHRQHIAVGVLVERDPNYLLQRAIEMYDAGTLEPSAKLQIIEFAWKLSKKRDLNQIDFVELYKRFLCDEELTVREEAGESLNFIEKNLRQKIYDHLRTIREEWIQGCMIYSFAFWNSDIREIECARLDNSKMIRYFAETAITMREKRDGLRKISRVFRTTQNPAERVAAYLAIAEQPNFYHIDELYRTTNHEHPTYTFLRSLKDRVERRVKDERKRREESERKIFCGKARQLKF